MLLEPIHACGYYAPEMAEELTAAGIRGGFRHYIAARMAPLGHASPDVVAAALFNFEPTFSTGRVPTLWADCAPDEAWAARVRAVDRVLRRLIQVESNEVERAAELAVRAARACPPDGRVFFASHLRLPWPDEPHLQLWHAITLLREFRGDGHIAAIVAAGLTGLDAHITLGAARGSTDRSIATARRGWSDDDWDRRLEALAGRGLMDGDALTSAGRQLRERIERDTNVSASMGWAALTQGERLELASIGEGLSRTIVAGGALPQDDALGMPKWWND